MFWRRCEKKWKDDWRIKTLPTRTRGRALAEGPRDALRQLKSCQLLHNCTKNHILKCLHYVHDLEGHLCDVRPVVRIQPRWYSADSIDKCFDLKIIT